MTTHLAVTRFDKGQVIRTDDEVSRESPLTLIDDQSNAEIITIVCSPDNTRELVYGYLRSEGYISTAEDVSSFLLDERDNVAYIRLRAGLGFSQMTPKRYLSACCGRSRSSGAYFASDIPLLKHLSLNTTWGASLVAKVATDLEGASPGYSRTGGVHNGALYTGDGTRLALFEDIGRHNVLDKLLGWATLRGTALENTALAFSGRVSSEVALKCIKMGCPLLVARSAPTDLAVNLARSWGLTLVAFARGERFNVYAHDERIEFSR
jgi:FdhD protein